MKQNRKIEAKFFLCGLLLFCTTGVKGQSASSNTPWGELIKASMGQVTITNRTERNVAAKEYERIYSNPDYCPYMIVRENKSRYFLSPGESIVERKPFDQQADGFRFQQTNFTYLRGTFPKTVDSLTSYLLPVRPDKEWKMINKRSKNGAQWVVFTHEHNDTVYASRGGTACQNNDTHSVLIYHNDASMANYIHLSKCLVEPGDWVEVGQPIGLGKAQVGVLFYYLDKKKAKGDMGISHSLYTFFLPTFSPELTPDIITKDMTKAQLKKWKRNH